ncbi:N-terminally processed] [Durusdinium trenchii]|uniref:N-terminally processed] n=1 Tax=Durusdinium trenchii TaxID=1381693 RepID=A0ABP0LTD7_9DINO
MESSDDEDDWCPKTQVGLQDLIHGPSRAKMPLISQFDEGNGQNAKVEKNAPLPNQQLVEPAGPGGTVEEDLPPLESMVEEDLPPLKSMVEQQEVKGAEPPDQVGSNGYGAMHSPAGAVARERRGIQDLPSESKLVQNAEQDKAEGVALFQSGQYFKSYQVWRRSIDALEAIELNEEESRKVFVALCSNAAQALLKCPEVEGAATEMAASMADKALSVDPCNTRALFRRGCAYSNAQGWLLARKDFEQVLRLEPNNEAARRELEKLEAELPPAAPDVLARRQEDLPVATVPKDPAAAVRMAQKEAERFRREILAMADKKGCVSDWCKKFNKVQVMAVDWAKHQLKDPEILQDLLTLRGPLFQAMDSQQREDFLCAYDFVQEVRQRHQEEIDKLFES